MWTKWIKIHHSQLTDITCWTQWSNLVVSWGERNCRTFFFLAPFCFGDRTMSFWQWCFPLIGVSYSLVMCCNIIGQFWLSNHGNSSCCCFLCQSIIHSWQLLCNSDSIHDVGHHVTTQHIQWPDSITGNKT